MAKPSNEELLTVKEAAAYLRVTARTMRRWIREGKIRHQRVGPDEIIGLRRADLTATAMTARLWPLKKTS